MPESLVIIPTYNEKENVADILTAVLSLKEGFHVVVVDDNSPDGTADIVKEMMPQLPGRLHLLSREGKLGLGTAYIKGFKWGLKNGYEFIFEMDADFSHNPEDLPRLLRALKRNKVDMVVGSRYTRGGNVENWPINRLMLSYIASLYVRMITWMPVNDPTAGFVGYSRAVLEGIDLDGIQFIGYAFQIEMKFNAWINDFEIVELPITFTDRTKGSSKMSKNIIGEAIFGVFRMKWNSLFRSKKKKELQEKTP